MKKVDRDAFNMVAYAIIRWDPRQRPEYVEIGLNAISESLSAQTAN